MKFKVLMLLSAFLMITLTNCTKENLIDPENPTIEGLEINLDLGEEVEYLEEGEVQERGFNNFTFFTLNAALNCTGLTPAVFDGRKTIYAPSDAAFAKLGLNPQNVCEALTPETLTSILLYHAEEGNRSLRDQGCVEPLDGNLAQIKKKNRRFFINDSRIYLAFNLRGKGYKVRVYAITDVLSAPTDNIVTTASGADMFSSLVAAVLAANPSIASALSNEDAKYTVFAPTNEAFGNLVNALGFNDLNDLVAGIGMDALSTVLLYHVVDACAFSNDLEDGLQIPTLQGETVEIDLDNLNILDKSGEPSGLVPSGLDILTSNGVVHTIDKVLLPEAILSAL